MKSGEQAAVVDLVLRVFAEFVAPRYSQEGVAEFRKFVCADALADRFVAGNLFLLAESGQRIIGVIEMRKDGHIALLFVEKSFQRRGIARELLRKSIEICMRRDPDLQRMIVNSSLNAVTAYERIGFKAIEKEQVKNGIRFAPMELILDNDRSSHAVN